MAIFERTLDPSFDSASCLLNLIDIFVSSSGNYDASSGSHDLTFRLFAQLLAQDESVGNDTRTSIVRLSASSDSGVGIQGTGVSDNVLRGCWLGLFRN